MHVLPKEWTKFLRSSILDLCYQYNFYDFYDFNAEEDHFLIAKWINYFHYSYYHHYQVGDYVLVQSTCRKFEVINNIYLGKLKFYQADFPRTKTFSSATLGIELFRRQWQFWSLIILHYLHLCFSTLVFSYYFTLLIKTLLGKRSWIINFNRRATTIHMTENSFSL